MLDFDSAPRSFGDARDDYDDDFGRSPTSSNVRRWLLLPGIGFLMVGGPGCVALLWLWQRLFLFWPHTDDVLAWSLMAAVLAVASTLMLLLVVGGVCLLRARGPGWAYLGAVAFIVVALLGFVTAIFIPLGVWAIGLLDRPDVKAEFRRKRAAVTT